MPLGSETDAEGNATVAMVTCAANKQSHHQEGTHQDSSPIVPHANPPAHPSVSITQIKSRKTCGAPLTGHRSRTAGAISTYPGSDQRHEPYLEVYLDPEEPMPLSAH